MSVELSGFLVRISWSSSLNIRAFTEVLKHLRAVVVAIVRICVASTFAAFTHLFSIQVEALIKLELTSTNSTVSSNSFSQPVLPEYQYGAVESEILCLELEQPQLKIEHSGSPSFCDPMLIEAWTREWLAPSSMDLLPPEVKFFCLAAVVDVHLKLSCQLLTGHGSLGEPMNLEPGSHTFVKVLGEPFLRVCCSAAPFGEASGHGLLADEKPIMFAGEVEIGSDSQLIRWNNLSGTYQPDDCMAHQAGLPLDRFWAVRVTPQIDLLDSSRMHITRDGIVLCRIDKDDMVKSIEGHL